MKNIFYCGEVPHWSCDICFSFMNKDTDSQDLSELLGFNKKNILNWQLSKDKIFLDFFSVSEILPSVGKQTVV